MSSRRKSRSHQTQETRSPLRRKGGKTGKDSMTLIKYAMPALVVGFLALSGGVIAFRWFGAAGPSTVVEIKLPQLSAGAAQGQLDFAANCVSCHGENAAGSERGPPLVHDIYNPGHHRDAAFYLATRNGVRQHHWSFGNMPAQPQISEDEIASIILYVRELQQANGIVYRVHRM